jgi:hypothetical protein
MPTRALLNKAVSDKGSSARHFAGSGGTNSRQRAVADGKDPGSVVLKSGQQAAWRLWGLVRTR